MMRFIGLCVALAVMAALFSYVFLGLYGALANVQEDDRAWNCHVMGDMNCGPEAPWHGFVNF